MAKKILVLSPLPEALIEALLSARAGDAEIGAIEIVSYGGGSTEDLLKAVSDADILLGDYTFNIEMDADIMKAAWPCLLIQQPSTGYQHMDVDAAARCGIPVANAAGANSIAVAEHTIMLILACLKKMVLAHDKTMNAVWAQEEMALHGVFELYEKTVGIIGTGRTGIEVARRAGPFGCNIIYFDVNRLPREVENELGLEYRPLDDLIAESDVITIHAPLTPETENLISKELIASMKPNSIIVNVARGAIVDEAAVADALENEQLGGAGIDVFSSEPIKSDNPLLNAPNVVLTPHIAGATNESRLRIIGICMDNIVRVLSGDIPVNIVNGVEPSFQ